MKWFKVPGYTLEVTKYGAVRDASTKETRKQYPDNDGYKFVNIRARENGGSNTTAKVHRLVARTFIGPCPPGKEVNHKDLKKDNNFYKNLEYKTHVENIKHARDNGKMVPNPLRGEDHPNAKLTWNAVHKMRALWLTKKYTQEQLADRFHICEYTVYTIVNYKSWNKAPGQKEVK